MLEKYRIYLRYITRFLSSRWLLDDDTTAGTTGRHINFFFVMINRFRRAVQRNDRRAVIEILFYFSICGEMNLHFILSL